MNKSLVTNVWSDVLRDCTAISIPDGRNIKLFAGQQVYVVQVLGGMFSVELANGSYVRIDGNDADAIGQKVPTESKSISKQDLKNKSIKDIVWDQLKMCYDPEIPINIVELGIIYNVSISSIRKKYIIKLDMTLTAPGCGMGEILKNDIIKKLCIIPAVSDVLVNIVFDPIWTTKRMSEAARLQLGLI